MIFISHVEPLEAGQQIINVCDRPEDEPECGGRYTNSSFVSSSVTMLKMYHICTSTVLIDSVIQPYKMSAVDLTCSVSRGFLVIALSVVPHQEHAWCRVKWMSDAEKRN